MEALRLVNIVCLGSSTSKASTRLHKMKVTLDYVHVDC